MIKVTITNNNPVKFRLDKSSVNVATKNTPIFVSLKIIQNCAAKKISTKIEEISLR